MNIGDDDNDDDYVDDDDDDDNDEISKGGPVGSAGPARHGVASEACFEVT